jgi:predicted flap endonuclease-1-like 5' DNA nuclease
VRREDNAALIEYVEGGKLKRAVLPNKDVEGKQAEIGDDVIESAIPYGDDLGSIKGVTVALVEQLHARGVWTKADVLARSHLVRQAIQVTLVPPLMTALLEFAKED